MALVFIALSFNLSRYSGLATFFAPFQGGCVIDLTQGRRAKRLTLATFCRASGAG